MGNQIQELTQDEANKLRSGVPFAVLGGGALPSKEVNTTPHSAKRVIAIMADERNDLDVRIKQAREAHTKQKNDLIEFEEDHQRLRALRVSEIDGQAELIAELVDVHGAVVNTCVELDKITKKTTPAPEKVVGRRVRKPRAKK